MGRFWIDVYEVGGGAEQYPEARLGAGPITSGLEWQSTARLDSAGVFSFTMPASDPRATLIQNRRTIWAYTRESDGSLVTLGAGIIKTIRYEVGSPTILRVTGPDMLAELADHTVGQLKILEKGWTYLNGGKGTVRQVSNTAENDQPNAYDGDTGTNTALIDVTDGDTAWWLYVGYDARFDQIRFTIDTANTAATTLQWQYYSNESYGWEDLTVTDTTISSGVPMAQTGVVSFTRPTDWARINALEENAGTWFYIRFRRQTGVGNNIQFSLDEVEVYADEPTTNGVNLIMAHAPTAWGVADYPATVATHYIAFEGESVLTALVTLAEHGGQEP